MSAWRYLGKLSTMLPLTPLAAILCANFACAEAPLQIGTLDENRPSMTAAKEVMRVAYARAGVPIQFVTGSAKRHTGLLQAGKLDGFLFRLTFEPDYEMRTITVPITREDLVVYSNGISFTVKGFQSLAPYSVGYVAGVQVVAEQLKEAQAEAAPSIDSLFRKLDAGRTDIAVDSRFSLCNAKQLGLSHIVILEPSLAQLSGYHVLHKKHQDVYQKLEAVLQKMEKDGEIKNINDAVLYRYEEQCKTRHP
ncbi:substrate-binding periplasmic protein [Undibacterium sp. Rencai35W]|uniref:substrate-binding periplasmic protein n=1 Tax=Undibacterium sp. Rencai35W TaxID=3413046 RepID=UPI003BF458ED